VIRDIEIRDLVVMSRTEIALGDGLTAITGESGAGKSVLARAFGLLLGAQADPGEVRPGARAALVQATVAPPPGLWDALEEDDPIAGLADLVDDPAEVVLARRVPAEGRARALVDGQAAPRDAVAALARACMRVVGQSEARRLLSPAAQLAALDAFAGEEAVGLAAELRQARRRAAALGRGLDAARGTLEARERERAELSELVREVRGAGLDAEEEAALRAEAERLRHAGRLLEAAATAAEAISPESGEGGALALTGEGVRSLDDVVGLDGALGPAREELASAEASLQEAALALRGYAEALEADPGRQEAVESRLTEYGRIVRRHGADLAEVLARTATAEERLAEIDAGGGEVARLAGERDAVLGRAREIAARLAEVRAAAAPALSEAMSAELAGLAMPHARVEVALASGPGDPPAQTCEIMLQVNPGLPAAPLAEAASGGELSRTLLALHSLAAARGGGAWVFDEVDAGVGGETAVAVGRRLALLAEGRQVLVITHLPQVAALADRHYRLVKGVDEEGRAETAVEPVAGDELVAELCRMLGSSPEDAGARRHAQELLDRRGAAGRRAA
jgi:DNA repair protein RecN (Recombination protein N)